MIYVFTTQYVFHKSNSLKHDFKKYQLYKYIAYCLKPKFGLNEILNDFLDVSKVNHKTEKYQYQCFQLDDINVAFKHSIFIRPGNTIGQKEFDDNTDHNQKC